MLDDFLFVDEILDLNPGNSIRTRFRWPNEAPLYRTHFPTFSVVPGVLIAEMMQQAGALCLESKYPSYGKAVLLKLRNASFHGWVRPGDELETLVEVLQASSRTSKMKCTALRSGTLIARSEVTSSWTPWSEVGLEPGHKLLAEYHERHPPAPKADRELEGEEGTKI